MLDPDQHMASVVREAGQEDLAKAIEGHPTFRCDIGVAGRERCVELAQVHQRQQILADALALALALTVAAFVGQIAVTFVGAIGVRLRRQRSSKDQGILELEPHNGVLGDG